MNILATESFITWCDDIMIADESTVNTDKFDKDYFKKYISFQKDRIARFKTKLSECGNASEHGKYALNMYLLGFQIDLIKASYSYGSPVNEMKALIKDAFHFAENNKKLTYRDIEYLLSWAIIYDMESISLKLISKNKEIIQKGIMLNFLASWISNHSVVWDKNLMTEQFEKTQYELLNGVFESDDKEAALNKYLDKWYDNNKDSAWYNDHLSTNDVYTGYWSFEAAAVAKILKLDVSKINKNYFPIA